MRGGAGTGWAGQQGDWKGRSRMGAPSMGRGSSKVKEEGWGKELPPFPPLPSSLTPPSVACRAGAMG